MARIARTHDALFFLVRVPMPNPDGSITAVRPGVEALLKQRLNGGPTDQLNAQIFLLEHQEFEGREGHDIYRGDDFIERDLTQFGGISMSALVVKP